MNAPINGISKFPQGARPPSSSATNIIPSIVPCHNRRSSAQLAKYRNPIAKGNFSMRRVTWRMTATEINNIRIEPTQVIVKKWIPKKIPNAVVIAVIPNEYKKSRLFAERMMPR